MTSDAYVDTHSIFSDENETSKDPKTTKTPDREPTHYNATTAESVMDIKYDAKTRTNANKNASGRT